MKRKKIKELLNSKEEKEEVLKQLIDLVLNVSEYKYNKDEIINIINNIYE